MLDPRLTCNFDHDTEMWHAYDYAACLPAGRDVYRAPTWERRGGVGDRGYIWVDDSRWSVDTPETPHSVLALMTWRQWHLRGPVDLRGARMSVYLRGDGLDLKGGRCLFWVLSRERSARFHLASAPLPISAGRWPEQPATVLLADEENRWHRSWTVPNRPIPRLTDVLGAVESYGFSFVGFADPPCGRFAIDEFVLTPAGKPTP